MKGQKMIETLARKRTQLGALAVLAGLVVALFAATISSQAAPSINSSSDSDFIIAEGGSITVGIADGTVGEWTFQPIFGFVLANPDDSLYDGGAAKYTHQSGAPIGDFTIRATHDTLSALTKTLTVGEAGDNLASANVILGYTNAAGDARALPTADGAKRETDTAPAGGTIFIEVEALNSLGEKSNVGADPNDLEVSIFAVRGSVGAGDTAGATSSATGTSVTFGDNTVEFAVSRADAGTVDVFAVVEIGTATVQTDMLTLSFSGGPDTISAGDASGGLLAPATDGAANTGVISFEITSVDKAGATNSASDTAGDLVLDAGDITAGFKIENADGDDVTGKFSVDRSAKKEADVVESTTAGETAIDESKISDNAIAVVITPGDAPGVPGGTYTATVTLDEGSKNSVEVTFNVTGPLDSLTAEADPVTVVEDGEFTVTATLLDANGLPVADGKKDVAADTSATPPVVAVDNSADDVTFEVIGGDLNVFGQDSDPGSRGQTVTKEVEAGEASATFYITGDSGKAIVLVRAGTKTARVTVATDDAAEEEAPAEVSLDCLSSLSGFSTYTCGVDSSASELFGLVSGRGATAIHLWNGSSWVRYSVVDGAAVPGSSDFAVTENDILYISN